MPDRPLGDATDADLAQDAAAGVSVAFEELYRRHAGAAWYVAYSLTGNAEDAADAVSEAYTRVIQALPAGRLRDGGRFRSYLVAAARNAAIDGLRRRGRTCLTDRTDELDRALTAGPPEQLVDAEESSLVARAFRRLPERWRKVLWLIEVEGVSGREAARLLGLSPNGVAQLAVRARAGLREGFLQAHLADTEVGSTCRFTVEHLGAYTSGASSARDTAKVDRHLAGCGTCRGRLDQLREVGGRRASRSRAA